MTKASEIFNRNPKTHNCAQAVAAGCDREDLVPALAAMGHGKAPGGRCGALHAALLIAPEESHSVLLQDFVAGAGAEMCKEIKRKGFSCVECVELAASLLDGRQD